MIMDMDNEKTSLTMAMLDDNGEALYSATYVNDGSGFVEVELFVRPTKAAHPSRSTTR